MRLPRATRLAVPIVVLALAGCGGAQVTVNDVPGGPVDLKTPGTGEGFVQARASVTPTPTPTETPTEDTSTDQAAPTATPQADTTTQETAPTNDGTGAATAPSTEDGTGTGAAQPPGSDASKDEFEDYCAQNPGAC